VAAVTPEELRQALAEQDKRLRRALDDALLPVKAQAQRIEQKVDKTNGRVTSLEAYRIVTETRSEERALAAKEAAALVAKQAAMTLASRERSRRWWIAVVTACITAVSVSTPLMSLLIHSLH
jgi:hypothetical protein